MRRFVQSGCMNHTFSCGRLSSAALGVPRAQENIGNSGSGAAGRNWLAGFSTEGARR